jgi:phage-related protein
VYISLPLAVIVGFVSVETGSIGLANIAWEGNSREVLSDFPERVKQNLGFELWRLQQGDRPSDYRPLPSIGTGVFELRAQDERAWYRVVYLARIRNVIYVLHCFEKKSREMPGRDFETAKKRLKAVRARLAEEKKHERRG